ncbi:MAG: enoyl-CoA hydratase-related protein [Halieaceae bacterium]|jgi:2-(1,2-epoxy-1,2-dihydrophenyl)acetyl-CoA isomerase|nr:enoyl-CoA hydratase-related protein [Halieaceae bacterium]
MTGQAAKQQEAGDGAFETLHIERDGAVARLVFNRPDKLNSFNTTQRRELIDAVDTLNGDSGLRVIILTGAGRAFSAGADLAEGFAGDGAQRGAHTEHMLKTEYKRSLMGIVESPKLWIAEVRGAAAGIGSAYMLACDFAVMAESSYLYQAFAAIGLIPDGGATWQLLKAVGRRRALEIILGGERIPAQRCLDLGLCNRVVPDGEEEAAVRAWAVQLAQKAPLAVQYSKQALALAENTGLGDMIAREAELQRLCIASDDAEEGVRAFLEKREANFSGR